MLQALKQRARSLKIWTYALYLACRDPRVPWAARLVALCVVAYAFSPFDLIPDFVPVLGYLDDLILVPLGITVAIKLIPRPILEEHRARAGEVMAQGKPVNWVAGAFMIAIWLLLAAAAVYWMADVLL